MSYGVHILCLSYSKEMDRWKKEIVIAGVAPISTVTPQYGRSNVFDETTHAVQYGVDELAWHQTNVSEFLINEISITI